MFPNAPSLEPYLDHLSYVPASAPAIFCPPLSLSPSPAHWIKRRVVKSCLQTCVVMSLEKPSLELRVTQNRGYRPCHIAIDSVKTPWEGLNALIHIQHR